MDTARFARQEKQVPPSAEPASLQGRGLHTGGERQSPCVLGCGQPAPAVSPVSAQASLPVLFSSTGRADRGVLWPRHGDGHEQFTHSNERHPLPKAPFGRAEKFTGQRERGAKRTGRKPLYDLLTHKRWHLAPEKRKRTTANINNSASFRVALCSLRRAFESIISSRRACGGW